MSVYICVTETQNDTVNMFFILNIVPPPPPFVSLLPFASHVVDLRLQPSGESSFCAKSYSFKEGIAIRGEESGSPVTPGRCSRKHHQLVTSSPTKLQSLRSVPWCQARQLRQIESTLKKQASPNFRPLPLPVGAPDMSADSCHVSCRPSSAHIAGD